jgi:hypothetical protein
VLPPNLPMWLRRWADLVLAFVEMEKDALAKELEKAESCVLCGAAWCGGADANRGAGTQTSRP